MDDLEEEKPPTLVAVASPEYPLLGDPFLPPPILNPEPSREDLREHVNFKQEIGYNDDPDWVFTNLDQDADPLATLRKIARMERDQDPDNAIKKELSLSVELGYAEDDSPMQIGPSVSWTEFYQSIQEGSTIQEIYLQFDESNPADSIQAPIIEGERKRYQRFRDKKFVCDECDRCFTLKQNVQHHILLYHAHLVSHAVQANPMRPMHHTRTKKRFKCLKCDKIFDTLDLAQRHDRAKHMVRPPAIRFYKCELCDKKCPSSSGLKEHVSSFHLNEKPFSCELCGQRFGRRGGVRRHHMMIHENRRFECPFEGCTHPGYKCSKALQAHIRAAHTHDRPFKCLICDKAFVRKNDLKNHEGTHTSVAAFVCTLCGKAFRRSNGLRAHKKLRCPMTKKDAEPVEGNVEEKDDAGEEDESSVADPPVTVKTEPDVSIVKKELDMTIVENEPDMSIAKREEPDELEDGEIP